MLTSAPETVSGITAGLKALLTSAAFAPLPDLGWIRITGSDRVRWLNGMVTNNIAALQPGEGCYNFFLNAQGRIQGDATAWIQEDSILLETAAGRIPALMAMLDHFIIMDDVELQLIDHSLRWTGLRLAGPDAPARLESLSLPAPEQPLRFAWGKTVPGGDMVIYRAHSPIVPVFEIWSVSGVIHFLKHDLLEMNEVPTEATAKAIEHLRILSGTPLYGIDIRDKDLAQETNQTRALHFSKGCYLGQEIVERVRSRGNVHRTFSGFILTGDLPEPGTPLHDPAKPERPIGELTSVARIQLPSGPSIGQAQQFALGYIRREALDTRAAITYPGGTATPSPLPFPIS
jgi:folate-binding protein YgfZ